MKILLPCAIGIVSFAGGVLFTLVLLNRSEPETLEPSPNVAGIEVSIEAREEVAGPQSAEIEDPERPLTTAPVTDSSLDRIAEAGGSVIPREMLRRVRVSPFNRDGLVSDELAQLFSLSEQEVSGLNAALRETRQKLSALELANVTSVDHEPTHTTIRIQAFPEEGAALRQEFERYIGNLLVEEGDAMIHHLLNGVASDWGRFGEEARSVRFGIEESPSPENVLLFYEDSRESGMGGYKRQVSLPGFDLEIDVRHVAPGAEAYWPMLSEDLQKFFTLEPQE